MRIHAYLKPIVFLLCLLPFLVDLIYFLGLVFGIVPDKYIPGALSANHVEYLTRATGDWALRFMMLVLAITPIKTITGYTPILRYRRMLGLYAFFYVCVHFAIFSFLDVWENADESFILAFKYIGGEIVKRPYITIGFSAFILLIPLAVTSTRKARVRMGKTWNTLHKLAYFVAVLGVIHYYMLVKVVEAEQHIYAAILALLFLVRFIVLYKKKNQVKAAA